MLRADDIAAMRLKMIEHPESALVFADETQDGTAGYRIERALDEMRATVLPGDLDVPPPHGRMP